MEKILFCYIEESSRSLYLIDLLKADYDVVVVRSPSQALDVLHECYDSLSALIVDRPSAEPEIEKVFDYVGERNDYLFALPVLILSKFDAMKDDEKYLSPIVVGMITEGETRKVILQRIKNTIKFSNSASFDEFSSMLRALPSLVYVKDKKGRYAFCSQHWHHFYGDKGSIRGLTDLDIRKNAENARIAQENDKKVLLTGKGTQYVIKEDDDEGIEYLQIIKEPLKNEKGKVTGIIAIINNVTDQELLRQQLREKSITDQLTGLYNRSYFEELNNEWKEKLDLPLTFISADCDGLKKINDRFGHAAGDQYICFARDALRESLPEGSYLFRMGGDEFLAVVPKANSRKARELVDLIVENSHKYRTREFKLKISVGSYTISSKRMTTVEGAVALSDKAMYKMKKSKR